MAQQLTMGSTVRGLSSVVRWLLSTKVRVATYSKLITIELLLQFFSSKYSMREVRNLPDGITVSRKITLGKLLSKHGALTEVYIKTKNDVLLEPAELTFTFLGLPKTVLFNVLLFFIFGLVGWGITQERIVLIGSLVLSGFFAVTALLAPLYVVIAGRIIRIQIDGFVRSR